MESIFVVISIVWCVLCLVLFFKVWGMCNDVSSINKKINTNEDIETAFRFLMRIGEKEKAKDILLNRILSNETIFDSELHLTQEEKIDKIFRIYKEELKALGFDIPQKEVKE